MYIFCCLVVTLHNDITVIMTKMDNLHAISSCYHAVFIFFARAGYISIDQIGNFMELHSLLS